MIIALFIYTGKLGQLYFPLAIVSAFRQGIAQNMFKMGVHSANIRPPVDANKLT
jgi:hypothetical protein